MDGGACGGDLDSGSRWCGRGRAMERMHGVESAEMNACVASGGRALLHPRVARRRLAHVPWCRAQWQPRRARLASCLVKRWAR